MPVTLIEPPADLPIDLADLKAHLRVDGDADDAMLQAYLSAALAYTDGPRGVLGRAMISQRLRLTLDGGFPAGAIILPLPPLRTVEAVRYIDPAGDEQTLPAESYQLLTDREPGELRPIGGGWPLTACRAAAVTIEFTAGHENAAAVPADYKHLLRFLVAHWYAQREPVNVGNIVNALPLSVEALIGKLQIGMFA